MMLPNIETFIGCESNFEEASIVLYGAPFDSTTSFRPGARFGPSAMRHESFGLETYSPYQDKDLIDISVFDSGDLELCFGSSEMALSDIQKRAEEILKAGKFPLLLGGEHLVTLAAVRAVAAKYPDLHIIHFDAHAMQRSHKRIASTFQISRVYQAHIPTFAAGYWLFGFASKKYHPVDDLDAEAWNALNLRTRYYTTRLHKGAFYLPAFLEDMLKEVED